MLKHIVTFKIKASTENEKKERVALLKDYLEKLPPVIPEIKYYEVGVNISTSINAFDLILISEFKSEAELETYRKHPEHQKVVDFINEIKENIVVVDYEK